MIALARIVIGLSALVVPRADRDEWREAWLGELHALADQDSRSTMNARSVLAFALGAPRHAVIERFDDWTMAGVWRDAQYAGRRLLRSPAYTGTIVLTLALGIGANAVVFSVVRSVLLAPLPFAEPQRLVNLWQTQPGNQLRSVAPANFLDWRRAASFDGLAAYDWRRCSLTAGEPERITVATVSSNFFSVLGVTPLVGHAFSGVAGEGGIREILLREDFWRQRFGGDRAVVGSTIRLDDEALIVRGIVPFRQAFPEDVVAWTQARHDVPEVGVGFVTDVRGLRDARYFRVVARLAPGVTRTQAQAEMDTLAQRLREAYPDANADTGINVVDLRTQLTGASAPMLWMLLGTVGCVLAIACANVASLLLASALRRTRELAVRAALGASRARLVRQLTIESLLLALAGSVCGLAIAGGARPAIVGLMPSGMPRLQTTAIDAGVVLFAVTLSVVTALAFGVAPALIASRASHGAALRDGGRSGPARAASRASSVLVASQLAVALVLVTATGLMLRTLWTLRTAPTGVDVDRVLALDVTLPDARARGRAAAAMDVQQMVDRLAAVPGVTNAGATQSLPLTGRGFSASLRVEGRVFAPNEAPDVTWRTITSDYFVTVGAHILRGRGFTAADRDGSPPVAIVNAALARLMWPDGDAIGARIGTGLDGDGAPLTIVGIVSDTAQQVGAQSLPELYRPLAQPSRFSIDGMSLVVRTAGDPEALTGAVRQAVRDAHPTAPVAAVRPLSVVAAAGMARERSAMLALAVFGGMALLLAAVGLYGLLLRVVGDRMRELGVRVALGAAPADIRQMIVWMTMRLAGAGCVAGVIAALGLSRFLGASLYGASAPDPLVVAGAAAVLFAAALFASYLPACRAGRVDPLVVMRSE